MLPKREPERRDAPPGSSWSNLAPPGATLSEHDAAYLAARGVTPEAARAAGYWTAHKPSETPPAFTSYQRRRAPTLIAPHLSPDGETVSWQKRDLHPGRDPKGDLIKWASPKAEHAPTVLNVHPWTADEVRRGTGPLWVCEGITRGHALAGVGVPAVTYPGCYSWQKDGEALPCWEHVNLSGRLVYDVPDADARTNANVHKAQARRVRYLESRGARVLVVSVPEVNGDPNAGLDDYIAAGGDLEALTRSARPFVPVDVGRERLKRDEMLRRGVGMLRANLPALRSRKARECSALAVARYMVEVAAPQHGKPLEGGIKVRPSLRQIASGVRVGLGTVSRALAHLELEAQFLKALEPSKGPQPATYLLLYPSGGGREVVEHMREEGGAGKEGQEHNAQKETSPSLRDSSSSVPQPRGVMKSAPRPEKVPALRNSKLVHTWARKNGRRVVVDSDYFRRYGKKREAIIRYVLDHGEPDEAEVHEKFGSRSSRLRDFRRTWMKPMLDDGVFVADGGSVQMAPDWPEALERVRERTDEELDNRLQDAKYADQRKAYRRAKDNPTEPTPELAGRERVAEIVTARERDQAARVEEQRRKVGTTPETFIADTLEGVSGFEWEELRLRWMAKDGRPEDLRRAVRDSATPYRFKRHEDGALYVERRGAAPEPEREPAEVVPINPDTVSRLDELHAEPVREHRTGPQLRDGEHHHGPLCGCEWCDTPTPTRYASAYVGSGA